MEIIKASEKPECFEKILSKLMVECNFLSPNWLPFNKKYNLNLFLERSYIEDISFIICKNNFPIIGFLGFISNKDNIIDIPSCLVQTLEANNKKVQSYFLKIFCEVVLQKNFFFTFRDYLSFGSMSFLSIYLLKLGANYETVFSHNINLNIDQSTLKQNLRKSYKSIVNNGLKENNIRIIDKNEIVLDDILAFRDLHIKESGRETRSKTSWIDQFEIVKQGEGFIVACYRDNKMISAGFFSISKTYSIYQVSVSSSSESYKSPFHPLMWTAILYSKKIGCDNLEVGDIIHNNNTNTSYSKKEIDISLFKTGFGGTTSLFLDIHFKNS